MKFETLKQSRLKKNIIIGVIAVLIISAIVLTFTRAKYRVTESIPLVNGTINYTLPDLNIVGLYIDGEEASELDSTKTYTLDTTQSTCTYKDGSAIPNLNINYDSNTGELQISPFTTKGTRCTLYFNEQLPFLRETILANATTQLTRTDFSTPVTDTTTGTIYYADTSKGRTYYFAGNPSDNWVRWAGFYWRIIRINEDGTIRMIYQGTSANTNGEETQIQTSRFNSSYNNNMYVGYMYTSGQVHGLGTPSTIKGVLDTWYQNNLEGYADDLDENAGFCGDRSPYSRNGSSGSYTYTSGGGTGTTQTYYGGYIRLYINKAPTFECADDNDLYTTSGSSQGNQELDYPIGLITADEVAYAGGVYDSSNSSYYLYTNSSYWTMSPFWYGIDWAYVFFVNSTGDLSGANVDWTRSGVRPVVNLSSDIQISSGTGTSTDPYVVN